MLDDCVARTPVRASPSCRIYGHVDQFLFQLYKPRGRLLRGCTCFQNSYAFVFNISIKKNVPVRYRQWYKSYMLEEGIFEVAAGWGLLIMIWFDAPNHLPSFGHSFLGGNPAKPPPPRGTRWEVPILQNTYEGPKRATGGLGGTLDCLVPSPSSTGNALRARLTCSLNLRLPSSWGVFFPGVVGLGRRFEQVSPVGQNKPPTKRTFV
jgi:hypothetical protein